MLYKKIVFKGPKEVAIEESDIKSPSSGQILVKTLVTLVSTGTELTMLSGEVPKGSVWDQITKYPLTPGYSNCGIVQEVGEAVNEFKVGDRLMSSAPHAEYALVRADSALKAPESIASEEATFGTLAATVMNSVRLAHIKLGDSVVIVGMGILGQLASQFCRLCGGFPVIAVDLSETRLDVARKLGANVTLRSDRDDVPAKISALTKGRGADVVFEATGSQNLVSWELSLIRKQGRLILLSSPRGPSTLDFHDYVNWPSRIIVGTHASSHPTFETPYNPWTRKRNIELFFDLLKAGLVNVKDLITDKYRWTEAQAVYRKLLDPVGERLQVMGVILDFR